MTGKKTLKKDIGRARRSDLLEVSNRYCKVCFSRVYYDRVSVQYFCPCCKMDLRQDNTYVEENGY